MVQLIGELQVKQFIAQPNATGDATLTIKNPSGTVVLSFNGLGKATTSLDMNTNSLLNAVIDTPTISNFTNANHTHTATASTGGTIAISDTTGTLAISRGGTNITSYAAGDVLYCSATGVLSALPKGSDGQQLQLVSGFPAWANSSAEVHALDDTHNTVSGLTAGQILRATAATTYGFTTATYPTTTTINQILFSSANNTISEITTGNSGILVTSAAGVPSIATDIPTAVTIGSAYVYRESGTDVSVSDGGTGLSTTTTPYGVICAGTSATTALQVLSSLGTTGQVLTSAGATALPTWQTPTIGDITSVTAGTGLSGGGSSGDVTLSLTSPVTAILGGTGQTVYVIGDLLYASTTTALTQLGIGSTGTSLTVTAGIPSWTDTFVKLAGSTMTGTLAMGTNKITSSYVPDSAYVLTNKTYVDSLVTGLAWREPVVTMMLVGNRTVAQLDALGIVAGDSYIVTDSGTLTRGSVAVVAGDFVEDNGTDWVKIVTNSGGFPPNHIRAILSTGTALVSPYTNATDDGKIVEFDGTSLTAVLTAEATAGAAVLVSDPGHVSYFDDSGFTFDGSVPTGTWVQFTGAGQINAGTGLGKTGNTLYCKLGAGIQELPTDEIGIHLSANSGLELTGLTTNDTLQVNPLIAGAGLTWTTGVLAVGAGTGILSNTNDVAINLAANLTWTGNHTFNTGTVNLGTAVFQIGGVTVTSDAGELNKLDGASANVTATNLNTLTASTTSNADALHTHTGLAKQRTDGGFTTQTSVTVAHNLARYPLVQVIDSSGFWIIPGNIQHTSVNSFTVTFASATTGTIIYIG